jgi:hypothetical protein
MMIRRLIALAGKADSPMTPRPIPPTSAWYLRVAAFMVGFGILITIVLRYYLLPAMAAAAHATPADRAVLRAHAALVLMVLLFVIFVGWVFTFRVGRYFFPRNRVSKRPPATQYPDAWAEAGRRVQPMEEDDE